MKAGNDGIRKVYWKYIDIYIRRKAIEKILREYLLIKFENVLTFQFMVGSYLKT